MLQKEYKIIRTLLNTWLNCHISVSLNRVGVAIGKKAIGGEYLNIDLIKKQNLGQLAIWSSLKV